MKKNIKLFQYIQDYNMYIHIYMSVITEVGNKRKKINDNIPISEVMDRNTNEPVDKKRNKNLITYKDLNYNKESYNFLPNSENMIFKQKEVSDVLNKTPHVKTKIRVSNNDTHYSEFPEYPENLTFGGKRKKRRTQRKKTKKRQTKKTKRKQSKNKIKSKKYIIHNK